MKVSVIQTSLKTYRPLTKRSNPSRLASWSCKKPSAHYKESNGNSVICCSMTMERCAPPHDYQGSFNSYASCHIKDYQGCFCYSDNIQLLSTKTPCRQSKILWRCGNWALSFRQEAFDLRPEIHA